MIPLISLSRAMSDENLLGAPFQAPSFWTWKTVAKLIDGELLREPREIEPVPRMRLVARSCRPDRFVR